MAKKQKDETTVELEQGPTLKLVARIEEYKGKRSLDIRQWWLPNNEKEFKPTSKGVKIPIEKSKSFWIKVKRMLMEEFGE